MILYGIVIFAGGFLVAALTALFGKYPYLPTLAYTWLAIVLVVLIDAFVATLCRSLPKKCADPDKKIFAVSRKEKGVYEKMKIRKWKDKIPEIGHFTGFRKNKIADPKNIQYIDRFLLENCYGEIVHFWSIWAGFLLLLGFGITPAWLALSIPVAIINGVLNVLPIFVLRYNFYKLHILRENVSKKKIVRP